MREGCEVHTADLRELDSAREATAGCTHIIHLAAIVGGIANFHRLPHTLLEVNNALTAAIAHAAVDHDVTRCVHVSSWMVFEVNTQRPTREASMVVFPAPQSAYLLSKLALRVCTQPARA